MSDDDRRTDWSVVPVALAFGLGMGAVGWWLTKDEPADAVPVEVKRMDLEPPAARPAVVPASAAAAVASAAAPAAVAGLAAPAPTLATAAVPNPVDTEFGAPLSVLGTDRPVFMNANEWGAIQSAVRDGSQTEDMMLDLVNNLRYRRLINKWQALPGGLPGDASPRVRAARLLLDDMRARLATGGLDIAEARRLVPELLADAVPNPVERQQAAQAMADAINQVQSAARTESAQVVTPSR